jgi:hypothetical protein
MVPLWRVSYVLVVQALAQCDARVTEAVQAVKTVGARAAARIRRHGEGFWSMI